MKCDHVFVEGFGVMKEAVVCIHCGKLVHPGWRTFCTIWADLKGNLILNTHKDYKHYKELAMKALVRSRQRV